MGFFNDIGNFISNNVQSVVHDVVHLSNQVTGNPLVQQILPIAGMALGIPPQITTAGLNVVNGLENQVLGNNNVTQSIDQTVNSNVAPDPFTPTAQTPDGQPLYKDLTDGKYHYCNDHSKIFEIPTTPSTPTSNTTPTTSKTTMQLVVDNVKSFWYWYVGAIAFIIGLWFYFKKPKMKRKW
jgi:hypothetical protein